jgi:hypothetical protein
MIHSKSTLLLLLLCLTLAGGCRKAFDKSALKPDAEGFIPWADAKRLILSGEVVAVSQTHARVVGMTLKDGTTYRSKEDRLDEVWTLIKDNNLQDRISFATE